MKSEKETKQKAIKEIAEANKLAVISGNKRPNIPSEVVSKAIRVADGAGVDIKSDKFTR